MPVQKGQRLDFLNAADAYDLRRRSSVNHLKILYGLIEDVERKIHIAASTNAYDLIYTVPLYSSELPMYNQVEMRTELVEHFRRHGFHVRPINQPRIPPTSFYISWLTVSKPKRQAPRPK